MTADAHANNILSNGTQGSNK